MIKKPFRVNIIVAEYDSDGFWDVFNHIEIVDNKKQLQESLERIYNLAVNFIEMRIE